MITKFINDLNIIFQKYRIHRAKRIDFKTKYGDTFENEVEKLFEVIKNSTMLSKKRLNSLYSQVVFCEKNNIIGDFVECGVWKGGAVALMASANLKYSDVRRQIHLFDIFDEICPPDEKYDGLKAIYETKKFKKKGSKKLEGIYDVYGGPGKLKESINLLQNKILYPKNFLNYHVGWFEDTIPNQSNKIEKIAILRLDSDWYHSTKLTLDYLYDKVVKNGFVIIDDYGTYDGCKLAVDEFMSKFKINFEIKHIDNTCVYFQKKSN